MAAHPLKRNANPASIWAAQSVWFNRVADQVTSKLIEKYKDKLAGVDAFTHDTVVATIISLVTDAPVIFDEMLGFHIKH